jgi:hypothetical protein
MIGHRARPAYSRTQKSCRGERKSDRLRISPSLGNPYIRSGVADGLLVLAPSCSALRGSRPLKTAKVLPALKPEVTRANLKLASPRLRLIKARDADEPRSLLPRRAIDPFRQDESVGRMSEGQTSAARTSHIECVRNTNHKIRDRELSSKSGGTSAGTDWHRTHADLTDPCHPSFPISLAIE